MLLVEPFRGLRYNRARVGSLSRVVTPPYDVISPEEQRAFYRRHRHNFIRVVYGKRYPRDAGARNAYGRARGTLDEWVRRGILRRDEEFGVYPYEQTYRLRGKMHRRLGVVALVRIDSCIYPHEEVHGGPKRDRLRLMRAVGASLDPIFGLVPDARGSYRRFVRQACRVRKPVASFEFQGVRHRLWRITDPAWIQRLQSVLGPKELVIADGHHRFEAARAYRDERRKKDPRGGSGAPYNFVMFYLSAAGEEEPGLLPTHRLVTVHPPARMNRMLEGAKAKRVAEPVKSRAVLFKRIRSLRSKGQMGIGLYTGNGAGYLLRPRTGSVPPLDTKWLHRVVLREWLKPDSVTVSYTQDLAGACRQVRRGQAQAVFVVQPPRLKEVLAWARALRRMPRKTTYFYPKLLSGLVEYPFQG